MTRYCTPLFLVIITAMVSTGCRQLSETMVDSNAGLNGGFESSQDGLPVNWSFYTPNTVPESDFRIVLDRESFKGGSQSLKFEVENCSSSGGWQSPGFTSEFFEIGKFMGSAHFRVGFWAMNSGTEFEFAAGGVSANAGAMETMIRENRRIDDCKYYEFAVAVAANQWLRLQMNILAPGIFWIDEIHIERMD